MDKGIYHSKNALHKQLVAGSHIFNDLAEENRHDRHTLQSSEYRGLEDSNSRINTVPLSSESRDKLPSISSKTMNYSKIRPNDERRV